MEKYVFQSLLIQLFGSFDDRKVDLTTYFDETRENTSELETYLKNTSEHWDREIRDGAAFPPIQQSERNIKKNS